ncbi:hypothetical protein, partial [Rhodococcus sp. O3]|uniref:hypothetical protein n=1 Tax=Rhodococcus sp. O3 TaxID=3404919 RepID=UPI003B67520C
MAEQLLMSSIALARLAVSPSILQSRVLRRELMSSRAELRRYTFHLETHKTTASFRRVARVDHILMPVLWDVIGIETAQHAIALPLRGVLGGFLRELMTMNAMRGGRVQLAAREATSPLDWTVGVWNKRVSKLWDMRPVPGALPTISFAVT